MAKIAHNLGIRRAACFDCYPHIEIGWIGNAAHQAEQSDHNPDARGIVHAIDVMVVKARAQAVVTWALAHPDDLEYVIHNRTIWTRAHGFKPKKYHGKDPHTNHVHISGRHGSTGENHLTGTGYNPTSEASSPAGTPAKAAPGPVKPPTPKKPDPAKPVADHKPGSRTLQVTKPRLHGPDVKYVQRFIGESKCGIADGWFGPDTRDGVLWYQKMRGIKQTGVVDATTWQNLGA